MAGPKRFLRFLWWNLQSFAHYDKARAGEIQWPLVPEEYAAKCGRIDRALRQLSVPSPPEVMAFGEVTRTAAEALRDRLFPAYHVLTLDQLPRSELQVAILYVPAGDFEEKPPLVVPQTPRGTRPMAILDHCSFAQRIRFVACHWPAPFSKQTEQIRGDLARFLNSEIYRFLRGATSSGERRSVVVVGDLNTNPFSEVILERLHAAGHRGRARQREHYTDRDVERVHLYNCAWRFLGEQRPHDGSPVGLEVAGTFYYQADGRWHTPDQVIVDGSLLTEAVPFLDETRLRVVSGPEFCGADGKPMKFRWNNGSPVGVSDHLPVFGQIVLEREAEHA
jgi:hypothetical protein